MKKLLSVLAFMGFFPATFAYDYPYLTFEQSDGTTTSVSVESLVLNYADGKLNITNADGTLSLTVSDLSKMYFSTSGTTGITSSTLTTDEEVEVYSSSGIFMGKFENLESARQSLNRGIYLIKTDNKTQKIAIK